MTVAVAQIHIQNSHNLLYHAVQYEIVVRKRITVHVFQDRSLNPIRDILHIPARNGYLL